MANLPYTDLVSAMHDNRRLWNGLPRTCRRKQWLAQGIAGEEIYLTSSFCAYQPRACGQGKGRPLIDINLAVMRGLMPQGFSMSGLV